MDTPTQQVRTYGGWRRSRGMGLFGLGPVQTFLLLATLTALVISATIDAALLAVTAVPGIAVLGLVLISWDGVSLAATLTRRLRWWVGSTQGHTSYRSGVMVEGEHAWGLPGVLAPTRLIAVTDPAGDYGIVDNRRLKTMTVTLRCAATSTWLADPDEGSTWVASWGRWLANLGFLPVISHIAVTVDSAPDPGTRLTDHIAQRIAPTAPAAARRIVHQLVAAAPATAADVQTRVAVTFTPASSATPAQDEDAAVAEISRTLPGLEDSLSSCGLTVLSRCTAADIVGIVRTAYDPAMRGDVTRLLATRSGLQLAQWLDWDTCGPVTAEEHLDRYEHDSGVSVSWAWHDAPRQQVHADILSRLVCPGPFPKRVTIIYRPLSAGDAARVVEREVNAAAFRAAYHRTQKRDESARDVNDRQRALRAAQEEATGAGIGMMSLFVTVTVVDRDHLPHAVADVESRADIAQIRLRRLRASQAAGFAATLPCGICPPQLARQWPH